MGTRQNPDIQKTPEVNKELNDNSDTINKLIDVKVLSTGIIDIPKEGGEKSQHRWYKISYKGVPLNIPLFQKPGLNIAYTINETFRSLTLASCREKMAGLYNTCSIDEGRDATGRTIKVDDMHVFRSRDFSDFIGINIEGGEQTYESIRAKLAENKIYPSKNTMITDFVNWWNSISTDKIFIKK